jgi:DNA polymerase III epsilon subunit-like protein
MIGTEKQVKWAMQIKGDFEKDYEQVPCIEDAVFWIQNRNASFEEVCTSAIAWHADRNKVSTPFTTRYSRYGREDALQALETLGNAVVIDTETSGLQRDKTSEVIELSIVELSTRNILFNSLIKPFHFSDYAKNTAAIRIHNIIKQELEKSFTLAERWDEIVSILSSHQIIAFNDSFDIPMLRRSALQWSLQSPRWYSSCALKIFSAYTESDDYYSLDQACQFFGIDRSQYGLTHRALADTLATCDVLDYMKKRLEGDKAFLRGVNKEKATSISMAEKEKMASEGTPFCLLQVEWARSQYDLELGQYCYTIEKEGQLFSLYLPWNEEREEDYKIIHKFLEKRDCLHSLRLYKKKLKKGYWYQIVDAINEQEEQFCDSTTHDVSSYRDILTPLMEYERNR